jgi:CheY-like chemotaxis protein
MHPPTQKTKVLVVDDELEMRVFLSRLLETAGYQPILAHNGLEGLKKAVREQPDLIILDVIIDRQGCLEMFDDLKVDDALNKIPVVMLSTIDEKTLFHLRPPPMAGLATDCRPEGFLIKPPEAEDLLGLLQTLTGESRTGSKHLERDADWG